MSVITLTTDFGISDWFVGTIKGVIAGLAPGATIVDITHHLPPGDIRGGAFALAAAAPYFPAGTIHLAVVDPGVGSARRALALRTAQATFIGPDNGVLSWAVRETPVEEMREISNPAWRLHPTSLTFHGRDVFAPAAARLAAGNPFAEVGEPVRDFARLAWPSLTRGERRMTGEVIYVDRFGNAITNLPADELPAKAAAGGALGVSCAGTSVPVHGCYADVPPGQELAVAGSSGFLELAVNGGSFAQRHAVAAGAKVEAVW